MNYLCRIIGLFCLLATNAQAANIVASLDRNPVLVDESFRLVLEADASVDDDPDFSVLLKDFTILSQSKSTNMTFSNGSFSHKGVWNLALMGKKPGIFTIPSIAFGKDQSPALRITINDPATTPNTSVDSREIYLESEVDQKSGWVQSPVIYTIRLYSSVALTNLRASELKTSDPDAIIEQLGEAKTFEAFRSGSRYAVREVRYVVYPQHSGKLTFEPMIFEGRVSQGGPRSIFDQYLSTGELKRLRSKSPAIDIKPVPSNIKATEWLPASKLTLLEEWSEDVQQLKAGEPVTRTITIQATGPLANSIPDIQLAETEGLKQYPNKPVLESKATENGVTSQKEIKIALIPTHAGEFKIPAVSLPWWNIKTGKQEIAHLPETMLRVTGSIITANNPPPASTNVTAVDPAIETAPVTSATRPEQIIDAAWWPWLSLVLGAGWFFTLLALLRKGRLAAHKIQKPLTPSLRTLEKEVQKSCNTNDAGQARDALLAWARARWPQQNPTSLVDISQLSSTELAEPLQSLNAVLYSAGATDWNSADLLKAFNIFKKQKIKPDNVSESPLQPLYKA